MRNDCKTGLRALCEVLGLPGLPDDPALIDQAALQRGGFLVAADPQRLHAQLAAAMSVCAVDVLESRLAEREVPCAKLRRLSEVVALAQQGNVMTLPVRKTHYAHGVMTDFGPGYKADRQDEAPLDPAPRLGQHTVQILQSIGLDTAQIDALVAAGTVGV